jgi:hypothetical protein
MGKGCLKYPQPADAPLQAGLIGHIYSQKIYIQVKSFPHIYT